MSDITEDALMIAGRSVGGRPRAVERGSTISAWIPESHHDRLVRLANLHDMSVSKYVASVLTKEIDRSIA